MTQAETHHPDHGGGVDAAAALYGGAREDWLDLSTGINPVPYPLPPIPAEAWTALPDQAAMNGLIAAARQFWNVPDGVEVVPAPGASALIVRMPALTDMYRINIPQPTYNEHARAFRMAGSDVTDDPEASVLVLVHPNNPDGALWGDEVIGGRPLTIIDESFCDVMPEESHIGLTVEDGVVVLKSFGKFWGLAGVRLGFAIGTRETLTGPEGYLGDLLGPWAVSGPAIVVGTAALQDQVWAEETRNRLAEEAERLDTLMLAHGAELVGGTTLFRLYDVGDAEAWQDYLAQHLIWTRIFPYSTGWIRLGLPGTEEGWQRLTVALDALPEAPEEEDLPEGEDPEGAPE